MSSKLAVCVLGTRKSGKSYTWNTLFRSTVRTGSGLRRLYLGDNEFVDVFLVSGSPEEREVFIADILGETEPCIVLCSIQYIEKVANTVNYFIDHGYSLFVQWLNPGRNDLGQYFDSLGLIQRLLAAGSIIGIRNGQIDPSSRIQEIREFIYGWAKYRDLLRRD